MAAPKTKARTGQSDKAKQQEEEKAAAAAREAEKESAREAKAREKAEAEEKARKAKIDSGDLIVAGDMEYEAGTKETKVSGQVSDIIDVYKASKTPLVFSDVCSQIDAKYPEDLIPAMHALEQQGLVRRFDARSTGEGAGNRRSTAYQWVG